jgi:biopolymer transport protein ExbD
VKLKNKIGKNDKALELQIAPLIDIVFLLLIYFMVTASLVKKEGDIAFILPAIMSDAPAVTTPVEALIEIAEDGTVLYEGLAFPLTDRKLDELAGQMRSLKAMAASQQSPFFVSLVPDAEALHSRVIDVMDACGAAGVESLTFGESM